MSLNRLKSPTLGVFVASGPSHSQGIVPDPGSTAGTIKVLREDATWAVAKSALFDHYADAGNTTTSETDLYSDTLAASTFAGNGDKVMARYAGAFVNSTSSKRLRIYLGGTLIFDTGALTVSAASDWDIGVTCIRESSSVVRCSVAANLTGASTGDFANYVRVTGLTLSGTNVLKITGTASGVGPATNDIVASIGTVLFSPAA
jgi:hypothetical protein